MAIEKNLTVQSFDVDAKGYVRPSALMHWMQQLAGDDLAQFGLSYSMMRERGYVFVLFASRLHMEKPLKADDAYQLKSYSIGTHGATFTRDFYFWQGEERVGIASTKWVLIDFRERKILPPSRLEAPLAHFPEMATGLAVDKRLNVSSCEEVDLRRVFPSMLDENRHLNNCVYADLATDYLSGDEKRFVEDLEILFTHEAGLGDRLEIKKAVDPEGNTLIHAFNTTRELPCFSAKITEKEVSDV